MTEHNLLSDIGLNATELSESVWDSIPPRILDNLYFTLYLGKIILILSIAYIGILIFIKIFRLFFGSKESRILKDINNKVGEILDNLRKKKPDKEDSEKKGKLKR